MTDSPKKTKVLVILPSYDSGGAEHYALRLIRHAGQSEFEWHVTTGNLRNAQLEPEFLAAGATTHHFSTGFLSPNKALGFARFLQKNDFAAVMSLNGVFSGAAMRIARMLGVPRRIAWHRRSTPAYRPTLARRLYAAQALRWLEVSSTHILSNSRAALDHFHGTGWVHDTRFQVIPNGVDAGRFRPRPDERAAIRAELGIPPDAVVIGHVGRDDPAKDHDTLLAATRIVKEQRGNVRLLLAGTGTDTAAFHRRVLEAGLADVYHGLGVRKDTERVYQAMDVFAFPSVTEGQPNALIEAILSGLPIAASEIPAIREALPPDAGSLMFPPRDVGAAATRVVAALADPDVARVPRDWAVARYDLARNLDAALSELSPAQDIPAHA
jgi:glycosyltransferase involved in cell wall biosynthesis